MPCGGGDGAAHSIVVACQGLSPTRVRKPRPTHGFRVRDPVAPGAPGPPHRWSFVVAIVFMVAVVFFATRGDKDDKANEVSELSLVFSRPLRKLELAGAPQ